MKSFFMYCSGILLMILAGCSNELEINAEWVETPVVYGLLNVNADTQYIRIEKTYQNSVNLSTRAGAQIADSLYFDTLVVTVKDDRGTVYPFHRVNLAKDPGFFQDKVNYAYKSMAFKPSDLRHYTLEIYNPRSGKTYTSSTHIVGSAFTLFGANSITIIDPPTLNPDGTINRGNFVFRFELGKNAVVYDFYIRFSYMETSGTDSVRKQVDYPLDTEWEPSEAENHYKRVVATEDFCNTMKKVIPHNPGVSRRLLDVQYFAAGGTPELKFVIDLSKPSSTIVEKKPEYSNINGGLGIFSSASIYSVSMGLGGKGEAGLRQILADRQF